MTKEPLDPLVVERIARRIAVAVNGGEWLTDYTKRQRDLWRRLAAMILRREHWS